MHLTQDFQDLGFVRHSDNLTSVIMTKTVTGSQTDHHLPPNIIIERLTYESCQDAFNYFLDNFNFQHHIRSDADSDIIHDPEEIGVKWGRIFRNQWTNPSNTEVILVAKKGIKIVGLIHASVEPLYQNIKVDLLCTSHYHAQDIENLLLQAVVTKFYSRFELIKSPYKNNDGNVFSGMRAAVLPDNKAAIDFYTKIGFKFCNKVVNRGYNCRVLDLDIHE